MGSAMEMRARLTKAVAEPDSGGTTGEGATAVALESGLEDTKQSVDAAAVDVPTSVAPDVTGSAAAALPKDETSGLQRKETMPPLDVCSSAEALGGGGHTELPSAASSSSSIVAQQSAPNIHVGGSSGPHPPCQ